ncbi:MAG TPA: type IV pilus secretin PilQ [Candidatus Deferrimicrobiaceae bacterium]|jgi:type IV pilus assembly protein PilQ
MMKLSRGVCRGGRRPAWLAALILLPLAVAVPSRVPAAEADVPAAVKPAESQAVKVKDVTVSKTPYSTVVEAVVDGKIENYNSFKLNDPFRIVVDIWGVQQGSAAPEIQVGTPQVKSVKLSQQDNKLRLLVETPNGRPMPFLVTTDGGKLSLSIGGSMEEKVTSLDRNGKAESGKASIVGVDLEDLPEASRVVITTSGKPAHKTIKKKGDVTLLFPGTVIAPGLQRAIDARTLGLPVREIIPAGGKKNVASISVRYNQGAAFSIDERENAVVVSFPRKGAIAKSTVVARVTENKEPAAETAPSVPEVPATPVFDSPVAPGAPAGKWGFVTAEGASVKKYRGQRISMDFKDADLQNVFRILAEVSNLNIVTTDDVKGKVTLRLVNVPWDQALDLVLQSKALGASMEGNILRVAPLVTLRAEEKSRLENLKENEKLKAQLESETETIPVNYGKAGDLQDKVKGMLSEGGKVQIDDRTNMLIVRDLRKNIDDVKALLGQLDTPIPQVLIEARIVEVDTSFAKDIGVQWGGSWNSQGSTKIGIGGFQDTSGAPVPGQPLNNTTPYTSATLPTFAINLPAAVGAGAGGGINFGILRDNIRLDLSLSALESAGKLKIVSSPKVVTIDNKEALIEQGTQIPYSTVSASGTQTQFIDATLSLKVTPHITPEGSVIMKLEAKNDSQGELGIDGKPAINKKKATTEVLVKDGDTAVIGGILQVSRNESTSGVPWFSRIPMIGWMFKRETGSARNRELLIFVTPRVMKGEPSQAAR